MYFQASECSLNPKIPSQLTTVHIDFSHKKVQYTTALNNIETMHMKTSHHLVEATGFQFQHNLQILSTRHLHLSLHIDSTNLKPDLLGSILVDHRS